jgi:hypothetical protein
VGAAEIRQPHDHRTRVGDRLFKRCEMDAGIAGRVTCDGRQQVTIGLRNILSRDSAIRPGGRFPLRHRPGLGRPRNSS